MVSANTRFDNRHSFTQFPRTFQIACSNQHLHIGRHFRVNIQQLAAGHHGANARSFELVNQKLRIRLRAQSRQQLRTLRISLHQPPISFP